MTHFVERLGKIQDADICLGPLLHVVGHVLDEFKQLHFAGALVAEYSYVCFQI